MAKTITKLTSEELWVLGKWLSDFELTCDDSLATLAKTATERIGRPVTEFNINGVLKMIGRSIPRSHTPLAQDEAIKLLAQCISIISTQLGILMPSKLEDLL